MLIRWGNKLFDGEVSPLEFWLPSRTLRLAFGASPDEHGTYPMLWTPDFNLTDEGALKPSFLKTLAGQHHAPRFDVFDVMVHSETTEPARAEALLLQLLADGAVRRWPPREAEVAGEPPPVTFKLNKSRSIVSSSRFSVQLPVNEVSLLRQPEKVAQLISLDAPVAGVEPSRVLFWRAIFCWIHSVHHGDPRWVTLPDGNRFCIELSVGNFPSLRCLYLLTDTATVLAHVSSIFGCLPEQLHLRALVILTVHVWPRQADKPGSTSKVSRAAGSGSSKRCWVWMFSPNNAVDLALRSPLAQVQGAQLNAQQMYCSFAAAPDHQWNQLPARLPPVSSAPTSENQLVLRFQAFQLPIDLVIGNLVRPGTAVEAVAKGVFIARLGRLLGKELLKGSDYDTWADFLGARLKRHPPSPDPTSKVHSILLTLDLSRACEKQIFWTLWQAHADGRLGLGFDCLLLFVRLRNCICDAHLGKERSRCSLGHVNCVGHGHRQV